MVGYQRRSMAVCQLRNTGVLPLRNTADCPLLSTVECPRLSMAASRPLNTVGFLHPNTAACPRLSTVAYQHLNTAVCPHQRGWNVNFVSAGLSKQYSPLALLCEGTRSERVSSASQFNSPASPEFSMAREFLLVQWLVTPNPSFKRTPDGAAYVKR